MSNNPTKENARGAPKSSPVGWRDYFARFMQRVRPLDHLRQRPFEEDPLLPPFLVAFPLNFAQRLPLEVRLNRTHLRGMAFYP